MMTRSSVSRYSPIDQPLDERRRAADRPTSDRHSAVSAAHHVHGRLPLRLRAGSPATRIRSDAARRGRARARDSTRGDGVLVLADLYGATPCNIAERLPRSACTCSCVSGLNLPMLLRVLNYPEQSLDELAQTAASGGRSGIDADHRSMLEREITITNRLGLHARASAKLVQLLQGFKAQRVADSRGREVNAKSIMGVMMLAAGVGATVTMRADGPTRKRRWRDGRSVRAQVRRRA